MEAREETDLAQVVIGIDELTEMAEVVHGECERVGVGRGRDTVGEQRDAATPCCLQPEHMGCWRNRGEQVDRETVAPSDESARHRDGHAVQALLGEETNRRSDASRREAAAFGAPGDSGGRTAL